MLPGAIVAIENKHGSEAQLLTKKSFEQNIEIPLV